MDNCEHLLEACSALIQEVLARCPQHQYRHHESRTAGASGELVYRVPSLELPSPTEIDVRELARLEAVQLFVERAWLTAPSFKLNTKTADPVAEICPSA